MQKVILITGSTDGIGLETARMLITRGHRVLIHGRNQARIDQAVTILSKVSGGNLVEGYLADLSNMAEVIALADEVRQNHEKLDVLINNAGVLKTPQRVTQDGLDIRFAVNTIAPYLLTQRLLPLLASDARIINLSSAAQASVDLGALAGSMQLSDDLNAYSQSKLALTMWSRTLAQTLPDSGPTVIAVNPGSLLATKMVQEGFGVAGHDVAIGADILTRLSLDDEFATASGKYFDNDRRAFADPHTDAMDTAKSEEVVAAIEAVLANLL